MAKLLGACFILMASYLFGVKIMERDAEHIRLLEEGELLYRILGNTKYKNTIAPFIWRIE